MSTTPELIRARAHTALKLADLREALNIRLEPQAVLEAPALEVVHGVLEFGLGARLHAHVYPSRFHHEILPH